VSNEYQFSGGDLIGGNPWGTRIAARGGIHDDDGARAATVTAASEEEAFIGSDRGVPSKARQCPSRRVPEASLDDVPGGRGVLVKILRVGVDGTDKEINAGEYGAAPDGDDVLILGYEGFGRVEAVGPNVTELPSAGARNVKSTCR
jgi:Alcohol dehydrogenase GroES-like domain